MLTPPIYVSRCQKLQRVSVLSRTLFDVQNSLDAYKPLIINFTIFDIVAIFHKVRKHKINKLKLCLCYAMFMNYSRSERYNELLRQVLHLISFSFLLFRRTENINIISRACRNRFSSLNRSAKLVPNKFFAVVLS